MQARAGRTRRMILEAAAETFEAHGYLGTTLQDVVAGRKVSKGALYFHFPSKEQLASAIITEQRDLLPRLVAELRDHHPRAIRLFAETCFRIADMLRDDVMTRAGTRLACERDHIGASAPTLFDTWVTTLTEVLNEAKEQGDLLPRIVPEDVAELVITAFAGLQRRGHIREPDARRHVATILLLLLPGMCTAECTAQLMRELGLLDEAV